MISEHEQLDFDEEVAPHVYLAAGAGGGMRSTIALRVAAGELSERQVSYTVVEGIDYTSVEPVVRKPSEQAAEIIADAKERDEDQPLLIIAHCMGTVAALSAIESLPAHRKTALVSIAPPLRNPRETVSMPQAMSKLKGGSGMLRIVNLPAGAVDYSVREEVAARIGADYFEEVDAAHDLDVRLKTAVEVGGTALMAAECDWNTGSPRTVAAWHRTWRASETAEIASKLSALTPIIPGAAHGLYLSPQAGGLDVTQEVSLAYQRMHVSEAISMGADLLRADIPMTGGTGSDYHS